MNNKRIASVAVLTMAISVAMQSYAEDASTSSSPVDATNTLPDAKPGECYAKVIVPAQFETRPEEIEVNPEQETIEIIPASFDTEETEVEISPAHTTLKVIPTKFRTEEEQVEVEAARNEWVTSLGKRALPASPTLLVAAKSNGIDIDTVTPGQCFREYYAPAQFAEKDKEVEVKAESSNIIVKAAEFEDSEETVTIKASYGVKKLVPAVYEKSEETIEIEPAKAVWKKGSGLVERIDNTTGEIMCLVNVPPKYETLIKNVLKTEAQIEDSEVPAETKAVSVKKLVSDATQEVEKVAAETTIVKVKEKVSDAQFYWRASDSEGEGTYTGMQVCLKEVPARFQKIKRLVVETPASVEEVKVAAETKVIKVEKVVSAAEVNRTKIPAETKTVEKRVKIAGEKLEWRRVLCQTNMTKDLNKKIQQALKDAGFYNGTVDGNIGRGTLNAVNAYQSDKGLPRGGLTIKVLEELGIQ
ncbi:MAG: Unknown protein [uncultured Thiotrichaceae bacterium]|uniref:Peptidoglycan binding-like domain-containing protein n=1 Tax=uncultured Thiotrichaceae bacterium TaxID=298394 RepID=A0A6S6T5V3_9GAMM|nr:MAG: Unknown protein [uncultured Thiotrichaceae bacterium]